MPIQLLVFSVFYLIFTLMSLYWISLFLIGIHKFSKYKRCIARKMNIMDSSNGEYCYHYETEIRKSIYLILMNLVEVGCGGIITIHFVLSNYYKSSGKYKLYANWLDQCGDVNNTELAEIPVFENTIPSLNAVKLTVDIMFLYLAVLSVTLMNYLTRRILKVRELTGRINCRTFLKITVLISVVRLVLVYFTTLIYVSILIKLFVATLYYIISVKTVNQYKLTLFKIAIQRLTQYGSNREELKQYKYFKYTINVICVGFLLILIAQVYMDILVMLTSIVFYQSCFFPFNMYRILPPVKFRIGRLPEILNYFVNIGVVINFIGLLICISPFIFVTTRKWIISLYRMIKGKSQISYRYNNRSSLLY